MVATMAGIAQDTTVNEIKTANPVRLCFIIRITMKTVMMKKWKSHAKYHA